MSIIIRYFVFLLIALDMLGAGADLAEAQESAATWDILNLAQEGLDSRSNVGLGYISHGRQYVYRGESVPTGEGL